jgi:hypothetical protein
VARKRPAIEAQTVLEQLIQQMAAKRALIDRIGAAADAGDQAEAERLGAEFDALYATDS